MAQPAVSFRASPTDIPTPSPHYYTSRTIPPSPAFTTTPQPDYLFIYL